jgi:uncharacterized protein (DUF2236 family)
MYHSGLEDRTVLGPDSLLWRWAGDTRIGLLAGPIGLLQTMHPAIGAALIEHSDFFADPADRVVRSLPSILGTVYDDPARDTGKSVRDYHRDIKGTEPSGRAYHALDPSTYWWAHATFQYMVEQVVDRFDRHRLTVLERERLYQEGVEWYRRYGVSDRCVPENRAAFQLEWDRCCEEELHPNPASDWLIEVIMGRRSARVTTVPHPLPRWSVPLTNVGALQRLVRPSARVLTFGGLPPRVRERFAIPWTSNDERHLRVIEASVRRTWRFLPSHVRWQPRAAAAWRRVGQRPPA